MPLTGKRILLGVGGGIAAYKSAYLTRLLVKAGADVQIIMTPEAKAFVGPLTFSVLSKHPVASDFFHENDGTWNNHVALGMWGDLFLLAPCTANTLAKMSHGICDNLLMAVYLSARCPVMIAPAMDEDMWKHEATQKNIDVLKKRSHIFLPPATGDLASGLTGEGRMAEPEEIFTAVNDFFFKIAGVLKGKKVLITAGPTYEKIDPVRFIGNHSTGKMGFALAEACLHAGAEVTVIHGPVSQMNIADAIRLVPVTSAEEMFSACSKEFPACDIFIAAAAVSDFVPENPSGQKIKKSGANADGLTLRLKRTPDILAAMAAQKKNGQLVIGFALETENGMEHAEKKLRDKNLDAIVLNLLTEAGAGFGHDTNKITILDNSNKTLTFELKNKSEVAEDIVQFLSQKIHA